MSYLYTQVTLSMHGSQQGRFSQAKQEFQRKTIHYSANTRFTQWTQRYHRTAALAMKTRDVQRHPAVAHKAHRESRRDLVTSD